MKEKAQTSEGKGDDNDSEGASGSEGEMQKQNMENMSYIESFIYPLEHSGIYKKLGGEKEKK